MRQAAVLLAFVVAALMALAVSAPHAMSQAPCSKGKSVTMRGNAQVRVYQRGESVFACYRRTGRTTFLDYAASDELQAFTSIRLGGRFVGFDHGFGCDRHQGDCAGYVTVVDVRSGKRRHSFATQDSRLAGEPPSQVPELTDFALRPTGSAALTSAPSKPVNWKSGSSTPGEARDSIMGRTSSLVLSPPTDAGLLATRWGSLRSRASVAARLRPLRASRTRRRRPARGRTSTTGRPAGAPSRCGRRSRACRRGCRSCAPAWPRASAA